MHQYTADLANEIVESDGDADAQVHVITTRHTPRDRFAPKVKVHPLAIVRGTGLNLGNLNLAALFKVYHAILSIRPDVVHFTGPHIWNPLLLLLLHRVGYPTIHTIHDLDPHSGSGYGRLLYIWNDTIKRWANHIVVHGQLYREQLLTQGFSPDRVTYMPLLHLFVSYESERILTGNQTGKIDYEPFALFFARLETYKGIQILVDAMRLVSQFSDQPQPRAVIAGKGNLSQVVSGALPANVEIRNRLIEDREAIDLFSRCGVVVLPYLDATQSALIAAAYFFGKPVIVTRVGALPEYVIEGKTGWTIEPGDPQVLAECLQASLRDPERLANMGEFGRTWYQAQRQIQPSVLHAMYCQVSKAMKSPKV
jgi:glycosyltransferase involved in cell wall biosynthesis